MNKKGKKFLKSTGGFRKEPGKSLKRHQSDKEPLDLVDREKREAARKLLERYMKRPRS